MVLDPSIERRHGETRSAGSPADNAALVIESKAVGSAPTLKEWLFGNKTGALDNLRKFVGVPLFYLIWSPLNKRGKLGYASKSTGALRLLHHFYYWQDAKLILLLKFKRTENRLSIKEDGKSEPRHVHGFEHAFELELKRIIRDDKRLKGYIVHEDRMKEFFSEPYVLNRIYKLAMQYYESGGAKGKLEILVDKARKSERILQRRQKIVQ